MGALVGFLLLELDEYLDNSIQHREVMGHESRYFENLFPAFMVLEGDEGDAFNPLQPKAFKPRLLKVQLVESQTKGKTPVVRQVPKAVSSLNIRDTFILDAGEVILVWHGHEQVARDKIKVGLGQFFCTIVSSTSRLMHARCFLGSKCKPAAL